ncbi:Aspercryptin biosynthesis cluster-specific transcription regulator atnN [Paramyrothecium foliicola]|nr:Aspercryptin biosynthesis cluster-specific transcription regulator atnN [Paramyrothecium foliicola]
MKALAQYNVAADLGDKSTEEKRYFEFFCQSKSLKIAGVFKSDFWDRLLIQVSTSEPAVFHALVAIGSAHRLQLDGIIRPGAFHDVQAHPYQRLALNQYNKAINELGRVLPRKDGDSLRIAAITCILFVCLEMMQGRQVMVEKHLSYGLVLIQETQRHSQTSTDVHLMDAFRKLITHLTILGQTAQTFPQLVSAAGDDELPMRAFDTVRGAVQSFEKLLAMVFNLKERTERIALEEAIPSEIIVQQAALRSRLSAWKEAYHISLKTTLTGSTLMELLGLRVVSNYHAMAEIILGTCLSRNREIAYDAFTPNFAFIISQNEDIMKIVGSPTFTTIHPRLCNPNRAFTLEMGGYPPAYFTALKCRDPGIRHRAILSLPTILNIEGMVNGLMLSQIAMKIFSLEDPEGSRKRVTASPKLETTKQLLSDLVPESSRFHRVDTNLAFEGSKSFANLTCTRYRHEQDKTPDWEILHYRVYFNT